MQLVITASRVIIGPAGRTLNPGSVLIDDDTITAVGPPSLIHALAEPDAILDLA